MSTSSLERALRRAVRACREDNWWLGLQLLAELTELEQAVDALPGYYYSYLGQAIARCRGQRREGLRLCRMAVKQQPLQPENHLNLAQVCLLMRNRRGACRAALGGLRVDPDHPGLSALAERLGRRRPPALPSLPRSHPLNRLLGRLTYRWARSRAARQEKKLGAAV